jgi:hypothetical protein
MAASEGLCPKAALGDVARAAMTAGFETLPDVVPEEFNLFFWHGAEDGFHPCIQ